MMGFYGSPVGLHHSHSSTCYLTWSRALLTTPLHVTVVVSFNLFWGQFGIRSSVVCNLHTECRPSGSGSPKSVYVSHKYCISVRVKVCAWANYIYPFKFNTALLPPLLAMHVWVVQYELDFWQIFMSVVVFVFLHSVALVHLDKSRSQKISILREKFRFWSSLQLLYSL